ncbi:uncharacterized protein VP01_1542g4 [Puccinia sorghi]|uniref:Uncharacterized protein n=1 Tax=Puccinia sorghi TaxID=27349 RepID=A0A0L6VK65_9BASI|nr:uncharacterized protein VP01_1542g4 [Puccinia sorghi]
MSMRGKITPRDSKLPGFGYIPPMPFAYPQMPTYPQPPYMPQPLIPMPGVYPAQPSSSTFTQPVPANIGPATSSPVPSNDNIKLEEYFCFAHVDFHHGGVTVALGELGINHSSQFPNFQASELEEAGMKRAHARALISCYKKFECHIKSTHPHCQ